MPAAPRKLALRRILALGLTLVLLPLAIQATFTAAQLSGRFAQWQIDRPVDLAVDLSQPGITTAPFHQTCQTAHGESLALDVDGIDLNTPDALHGLAGSLNIAYEGTLITTANLADAIPIDNGTPSHQLQLAYFAPFSTGTYTLILQVDQPAPLLAHHPQRLTAQYFLCGMEKLPESLATALATLWWLLTLTLGVPTLLHTLKYGWHAKP